MRVSLYVGGFPSDTASVYPRLGYHRPVRNSHFQWDSEHLGQAARGFLGSYEIYVYRRVGELGGLFKTYKLPLRRFVLKGQSIVRRWRRKRISPPNRLIEMDHRSGHHAAII